MALDAARTTFGYAITCTGGTAAAQVIVGPTNTGNQIVQINGIYMTGAATTDIVTVTDFSGNCIFRSCATNTNGGAWITFNPAIRVDGLKVGVAGATSGWCTIFCQ